MNGFIFQYHCDIFANIDQTRDAYPSSGWYLHLSLHICWQSVKCAHSITAANNIKRLVYVLMIIKWITMSLSISTTYVCQ